MFKLLENENHKLPLVVFALFVRCADVKIYLICFCFGEAVFAWSHAEAIPERAGEVVML